MEPFAVYRWRRYVISGTGSVPNAVIKTIQPTQITANMGPYCHVVFYSATLFSFIFLQFISEYNADI